MASLKDLKVRITSVKNTQKITKAMKMVAAAKLRRAQEQAEAGRPYAAAMEALLARLAANVTEGADMPLLMRGTGGDQNYLLLVLTADRGLAGAFNASIVRAARLRIRELQGQGKKVQIYCVGRKGYELLRRQYKDLIVGRMADLTKGKEQLSYQTAQRIADAALEVFREHNIDVVEMVYNRFRSAIAQIVTWQQLIPLPRPDSANDNTAATQGGTSALYEYEPAEEQILEELLPRNLAMQVYRGLLENNASEQGARMTAMDNATRNAGEMIGKLTLVYNRTRQAAITTELTEIISGAEAV